MRRETSYMQVWDITSESYKHPSGGLRCILARPEIKPQHTASSCPRAPVMHVLGTADVVMFDISSRELNGGILCGIR